MAKKAVKKVAKKSVKKATKKSSKKSSGKKWIKDALSSGNVGALRKTASRKGLLKGKDDKLTNADLNKLKKMGGKTAKRAVLAKTLKSFKKK